MEKDLKILIENDLCTAISTFHDCNSASERNALVKNYTINFCKTYNLDVMEVIDFLIEYFDKKRKSAEIAPGRSWLLGPLLFGGPVSLWGSGKFCSGIRSWKDYRWYY